MKKYSNLDIFSTMENEMKQIMDLFAKERKTRKKEIAKLKSKLTETENTLNEERTLFRQEKSQILEKWKSDSNKHEEFYNYVNQKLAESDRLVNEYKQMCLDQEAEKKHLIAKLESMHQNGNT